MHIAIFVDFHDSSVGGVQTSVRGQRQGLEALGHTVTIISPPPVGGADANPATICVPAVPFVQPNGFPMVAPTRANQRFIEAQLDARGPVDIIHAQTNMGLGILGLRIARKRAIPLVQTMHGRDDVFAQHTFPLPPLTTALLRLIHHHYLPHTISATRLQDNTTAHNAWQVMINHAQAVDHVVVPSHHFSVKFKEHGLTTPVTIVSNGINDDVIAQLPVVKKEAALSAAQPLRVIWCGRLSPEKRPLESIKAVSQLSDCQLDMYGNGALAGELQAYIDKHGLSKRVRLRGKVSQVEIIEAMQDHDVLLYPSFGFDNQPMVLLEAVAAGIPVIYCDPDLTECMPRQGSLLTDDGTTVAALSRALEQLQRQPGQRARMHQAMLSHRSKVVQSYHSKKMVALYRRLASGRTQST
jgi:glycosyltransferase involved in cell wall biosynthesis